MKEKVQTNQFEKIFNTIAIICFIVAIVIFIGFIANIIKLTKQFKQETIIYRTQLESMLTDEEINELLEAGKYE